MYYGICARIIADGSSFVGKAKSVFSETTSSLSEKNMTVDKDAKGWVYVFICKSDDGEDYLGLFNEEQKVNFIPAFQTKDDANDCFLSIPRDKGKRYEVQAVHLDELNENASNNNFVVTLVDKDGKILK